MSFACRYRLARRMGGRHARNSHVLGLQIRSDQLLKVRQSCCQAVCSDNTSSAAANGKDTEEPEIPAVTVRAAEILHVTVDTHTVAVSSTSSCSKSYSSSKISSSKYNNIY